jgi:hypothetical protein
MIYALVEPSIYMIASILPTTRHLYRRVYRNVQRAAQLRSAKSNSDSNNNSQSAELGRIGNSDTGSRKITRPVDVWEANANSSQEELTLEEWIQFRPAGTSSPGTPEARSFVSSKTTKY